MKIVVDSDMCEHNAVCVGEAPDVFGVDEEGQMVVLVAHPSPAHAADARKAVARCPRGALSLVEDS